MIRFVPDAAQRYRFDRFTLDLGRASLLRDGEPVSLRPRSFDALRFLVENRGRLATKEQLVQALWPRTVVTDDSLVKCIQDIRTALGDDARLYIKTVPRRGYIFDAPVTIETALADTSPTASPGPAAPPAIAPNPEPAARTAPVTAERSLRSSQRRLVLGAAGLAALALIVGGYFAARRGQTPPALPRSIAVLPFENVGGNQDSEYFATGVHESLLNQLAKLNGVKTIARTSVLRYAGSDKPIHEIARELNVETVVEGSVQYADGRVRVTAQLIDPGTDTHLWSEVYDRPFADIFAIQTDIASRIAAALDLELSASEEQTIRNAGTASPEAYELYLRGRYHWDKWSGTEAAKSIEYFEQAIRYDPSYALAYTGLADAYAALQGLGVAPGSELMPKAKQAVERALEIDPDLPEAYVARALIKQFYDWDYEGGNADSERAIALNPQSASAHHLFGKNLVATLQFDRAFAELDRALELEPFSVGINKDLGETLYLARRNGEAIAQFERVLELEPNSLAALFWLSRCYEVEGDHDTAARYYLELSRQAGEAVAPLEEAYARDGPNGLWRTSLMRLEAQTRYVEPFWFVDLHLRLGERDAALDWLERAFEARSAWIPVLAIEPHLDSLRGSARLEDLERRAGLRPKYVPPR